MRKTLVAAIAGLSFIMGAIFSDYKSEQNNSIDSAAYAATIATL